jgi:predicted MFS family arabinose efflux permease
MITTQPTSFARDRFTWLAYLLLGYYAYYLNAPGVAMPLLRADLNLSFTLGGLHMSALALGMVGGGLLAARIVWRFGRRAVIWGGGAGLSLGALLFAAGRHPALTLPAIALMGIAGTTFLATIQSSLADRHGRFRALALTEANVAASATSVLAPVLIGTFARTAIGWRAGFALPVLAWAAMFWLGRSQTVPAHVRSSPGIESAARLPRLFWYYWVALVMVVSVEWSIISWGADFLVEAGSLARADASLIMSAFFVAMLIGRTLGTMLARRFEIVWLLLGALAIALAGFLLFWLASPAGLRIAGLFIAGLGVANLFPFLLSIGMGVAAANTDLGSARLTMGVGLAILLAPLTLGWIADQSGIATAYQLTAVLLVLAISFVLFTRRLEARTASYL